MIRWPLALWLACFMITGAVANEHSVNVAVQRILAKVADVEVPVRVFYPTAIQATETRFGPWKLQLA